jgi:hypothetical protein
VTDRSTIAPDDPLFDDPEFRAFYEKFGDPITVGRCHARRILREERLNEPTRSYGHHDC